MNSKKIYITASLFLIGTLHTFVFSFFQFPGTFIAKDLSQDPIVYKVVLYFFTIAVSCFHQFIARRFGLKKVLIAGLMGNIIGLIFLFFHHRVAIPAQLPLLIISMITFGSSNLMVINSLITFVILEFPAKTITAITSLFIFLNLGIFLTPLVLEFMEAWSIEWNIIFILSALFILAISLVWSLFSEPLYPKNLEHLRSGSILWKEMHKRLSLYVLAIFLYALVETTFSLWGSQFLLVHEPMAATENALAIFWGFMILGQISLIIPLYYFQPRKIFYLLVPVMAFALIFISRQTQLSHITLGLALGGMSCAVVFPIVLSLLEMELIQSALMSHHAHYLPLVDTSVSFLMAGYFLAPAVFDFWLYFLPNQPADPFFRFAVIIVAAITALMIYLNKTRLSLLGGRSFQ